MKYFIEKENIMYLCVCVVNTEYRAKTKMFARVKIKIKRFKWKSGSYKGKKNDDETAQQG